MYLKSLPTIECERIRPATAAAVFLFPQGGSMAANGGRDRYPCGKAKPVADHGTPELQLKRAASARGEDPKYASYSLGRLYAARVVMQGERWAGDRYALLFTLAVRPVFVASMLANLVAGGMLPQALAALSDESAADFGAEARQQYLAARELLSPWEARAVDAICVYQDERLEQSMLARRSAKATDNLNSGLDKLHRHFEASDRRAKAAADAPKRAAD